MPQRLTYSHIVNENPRRSCTNCGAPLAEAEVAFGVRLCGACSSTQAGKALHIEQDSYIQRNLMTAGLFGLVWGVDGVAAEPGIDAPTDTGSMDVGGFDAGGGGGD